VTRIRKKHVEHYYSLQSPSGYRFARYAPKPPRTRYASYGRGVHSKSKQFGARRSTLRAVHRRACTWHFTHTHAFHRKGWL
jgi:hypothetical protein